MILIDRIELNPRICNGRPVIKGTRIPVSMDEGLMACRDVSDSKCKFNNLIYLLNKNNLRQKEL